MRTTKRSDKGLKASPWLCLVLLLLAVPAFALSLRRLHHAVSTTTTSTTATTTSSTSTTSTSTSSTTTLTTSTTTTTTTSTTTSSTTSTSTTTTATTTSSTTTTATLLLQEGVSGGANTANMDTYINDNQPTTNQSAGTTIRAGRESTNTFRTLIKFDLSAIAGRTVNSATLTLTVTTRNGTPGAGSCYRIRRTGWVHTQATWNVYSTGNNWTTAGAGDTTNDYDTSNPGTYSIPASTVPFAVVVTLPAALVQDALDNRSNILHLVCRQDTETNATGARFDSSEGTTSSQRPLLSVVYH